MKTPIKSFTILLLVSAVAAVFSSGCGTIRGFGRDVETVGDGIERSAR